MNMEHTQFLNPDETVPAEPVFDVVSEIEEAASGPKVAARLIEYAPGRRMALPPHTVYGLVEQPAFVEVPGAARYGLGLMTWQDMRLPLLDFDALMHADASAAQTIAPNYALIVAYQSAPNAPIQYGAIGLKTMPQTISVGDDAQCALPEDSARWPLFALSCFQYEDQAIPIVDTARVFAVAHG
jgi:hypothetical protein